MSAGTTIAILAATSWEFRAIRSALSLCSPVASPAFRWCIGRYGPHRVVLSQMGMGPVKAMHCCRELCASWPVDLIVISGFIGALRSARIGTLIVAQSVESYQPWPATVPLVERLACDPMFTQRAVALGAAMNIPVMYGAVVTVGRVVSLAREKHKLANDTGAVGVDMESAAVGQVAREWGCPFVVVRAITDGIDDDMPIDFNAWGSPAGWVRGIATMMLSPQRLIGVYRLKGSMERASCTLTRFFGAFLQSAALDAVSATKTPSAHD